MQKNINKRSKLDYIVFLLLLIIFIGCTREGRVIEKPKAALKVDSLPIASYEPVRYSIRHKRIFKDSSIEYRTDSIIFRDYDIVVHHFGQVNYYSGKEIVYDDFNHLEILKDKKRIYIMDSASFNERLKIFLIYRKNKTRGAPDFSTRNKIVTFNDLFDAWNKGNVEQIELDTIKYFLTSDPPKLILWGDTKGMHCCKQLFIYELGEKFREIARIEAAHLDFSNGDRPLMLHDLDNDSVPEITFYDPSWRYWNNSAGYEAPYFKTILKYSEGEYHLYKEKMFKPLPSKQKYDEMVRKCQRLGESVNNTSTLWSYMLELIYSGHFNNAIEFLNEAWPKEIEGKEKFFRDFMDNLYYVQYGNELIEWGDEHNLKSIK